MIIVQEAVAGAQDLTKRHAMAFVCPRCQCKWVASEGEYKKYSKSYHSAEYDYWCDCPGCGIGIQSSTPWYESDFAAEVLKTYAQMEGE